MIRDVEIGPKRVEKSSPVASFVRDVPGGVEIDVKVVPGASRTEVAGLLGDRLKVRVAAPPEDGRANDRLLDLLERKLGVSGGEIIRGKTNRQKTIRFEGLTADTARRLLGMIRG